MLMETAGDRAFEPFATDCVAATVTEDKFAERATKLNIFRPSSRSFREILSRAKWTKFLSAKKSERSLRCRILFINRGNDFFFSSRRLVVVVGKWENSELSPTSFEVYKSKPYEFLLDLLLFIN